MRQLIALIEDPGSDLPETACATRQVLVDGLRHLDERIAGLDVEIARRAREDEDRYAERSVAVRDGDADLDLYNLAVEVPRHEPLA